MHQTGVVGCWFKILMEIIDIELGCYRTSEINFMKRLVRALTQE